MLCTALVQSIRQRQRAGVPASIRQKTLLHIADTVGTSLAAYRAAPVVTKAIAGVIRGSAGGSSQIIGSSLRLPPPFSAFANTALAHAADFDDIHDLARVHPTPVNLASALAVAPLVATAATDLVTAVSIGNELMCRMGLAVQPKGTGRASKWFLSQLFGYISGAVTAGLVLGLSDEQLENAIGLAYMQLAGGKEPGLGTGSEARSIYPAFASMGGVQAALMAQAGVTASKSSLDGIAGLFPLYLDENLTEEQLHLLLDRDDWSMANLSIKLYPSCRYSHPYVRGALKLYEQNKADDIKKIVIGINETSKILCYPLAERRQPVTLQDAKFSLPFLVPFVWTHGQINLSNLTLDSLKDQQVLALAQLVELDLSQEDTAGMPLGQITVYTDDDIYRVEERLPGNVSPDEVRAKFFDCCQYAHVNQYEELWDYLSTGADYELLDLVGGRITDEHLRINEAHL